MSANIVFHLLSSSHVQCMWYCSADCANFRNYLHGLNGSPANGEKFQECMKSLGISGTVHLQVSGISVMHVFSIFQQLKKQRDTHGYIAWLQKTAESQLWFEENICIVVAYFPSNSSFCLCFLCFTSDIFTQGPKCTFMLRFNCSQKRSQQNVWHVSWRRAWSVSWASGGGGWGWNTLSDTIPAQSLNLWNLNPIPCQWTSSPP